MNNFWSKIKKPILVLAPLAGYTDSPFRQICKEFGADVVYSEMASATALFYAGENLKDNPTLELIKFIPKEKPYVVQLFGNDPKHFAKAVQIITEKRRSGSLIPNSQFLIPDGIDINFGCPVPKVAKQKAGAELFKDLKRSREVIKAVIDNTDLPVSIKIRTKAGEVDCLKFLNYVSDLNISAVMIHGRTLKQGFTGPIDTAIIKKARDYFGGVILANGGINTREDAERVLAETEADGLGIGRGALGRPWIFSQLRIKNYELRMPDDIFKIALKHAKLMEKFKGKQGIIEMRKHLCWYVQGVPGAKRLREQLIQVNSLDEIKKIFKNSAV